MNDHHSIIHYKKNIRFKLMFLLFCLILLVVMVILALLTGSADINFADIFRVFSGQSDELIQKIIIHVRLPRIVAAILAGAALSVSGTVIQSLLRNPLASPFTLGISGSSAFGAAFAIVLIQVGRNFEGSGQYVAEAHPFLISGSALIWSLIGISVILALSKLRGGRPEVVILAGIIMSSLFGAGISAMQYFADQVQLSSIVLWSFGDLGRANWTNVIVLFIVTSITILYFFTKIWNYKVLQSGDEFAQSTGVHVRRIRLTGMVVACLATSVVVSFYGVIAFVGLVVPHILRRIIGGDEQYLIPASVIFGGLFVLIADTLSRTVISPVILPVGILTSFLGAPLFLFLLMKRTSDYWD